MPPKSKSRPDPRTLLKYDFERLFSGYNKSPPEGYVFVPKGDIYITRHCRELTRRSGQVLYIVYDPPSSERLGLHCPIRVGEVVNMLAKNTSEKRESVVAARDRSGREAARKVLLKHFPSIPDDDLETILDHGFEKGSRRVGRSTKLDKDKKAVLAVQAHVRHRHTKYEALLKEQRQKGHVSVDTPSVKAIRHQVRPKVEQVASQWRARKAKQDRPVGEGLLRDTSNTKTRSSESNKTPHKYINKSAKDMGVRGPERGGHHNSQPRTGNDEPLEGMLSTPRLNAEFAIRANDVQSLAGPHPDVLGGAFYHSMPANHSGQDRFRPRDEHEVSSALRRIAEPRGLKMKVAQTASGSSEHWIRRMQQGQQENQAQPRKNKQEIRRKRGLAQKSFRTQDVGNREEGDRARRLGIDRRKTRFLAQAQLRAKNTNKHTQKHAKRDT